MPTNELRSASTGTMAPPLTANAPCPPQTAHAAFAAWTRICSSNGASARRAARRGTSRRSACSTGVAALAAVRAARSGPEYRRRHPGSNRRCPPLFLPPEPAWAYCPCRRHRRCKQRSRTPRPVPRHPATCASLAIRTSSLSPLTARTVEARRGPFSNHVPIVKHRNFSKVFEISELLLMSVPQTDCAKARTGVRYSAQLSLNAADASMRAALSVLGRATCSMRAEQLMHLRLREPAVLGDGHVLLDASQRRQHAARAQARIVANLEPSPRATASAAPASCSASRCLRPAARRPRSGSRGRSLGTGRCAR